MEHIEARQDQTEFQAYVVGGVNHKFNQLAVIHQPLQNEDSGYDSIYEAPARYLLGMYDVSLSRLSARMPPISKS